MVAGIKLIQTGLEAMGYSPGAIDGIDGPKTRAAAVAWGQGVATPVAPSLPADWDARSAKNLVGVHPDMVRVVSLARTLSAVPFIITEGLRTKERQAQLVKSGASQTMNSRHLTGHAVDVAAMVGGKITWDWPLYERIAVAMKQASDTLAVSIIWGGDWKSFKDGPHYELNRALYPA